MSNDENEWSLLSNLDDAIIALQLVTSLASVLADGSEAARYRTATFDEAMLAFTAYLDLCIARVNECKNALFKNYRARKGISEVNAEEWWQPEALQATFVPAKKVAAKKSRSTTKKKAKRNVKK